MLDVVLQCDVERAQLLTEEAIILRKLNRDKAESTQARCMVVHLPCSLTL